MSTNILETETFSITRFFGGRYRGVCYQINVAGSPGYVQLTRDEAVLLRSALTDELFGVPSEATPSKENEMVGSTGRIHKKTHDCETAGCRPAPAPEVQGTPAKKSCLYCNEAFSGCSMCRTQVCAICGEPVQNGVTCHEGKVISGIRTAPVGTPQKCPFHNAPMEDGKCTHDPRTPQKETPTMPYGAGAQNFGAVPEGTPQKETPTMPYGAGAQNFGVKTYAETADQIRAATFVGTDKFVQTDTQQLPASVPEGVQGKEPQTPEEERYESMTLALEPCPDCGSRHHRSCAVTALSDNPCIVAGDIPADRPSPFLSEYLRGEAAGRRSAITEMQEWILTVREDPFDPWSAGYNKGYDDVSKKCAELQEKTKP